VFFLEFASEAAGVTAGEAVVLAFALGVACLPVAFSASAGLHVHMSELLLSFVV
jgi:hypothetical protein